MSSPRAAAGAHTVRRRPLVRATAFVVGVGAVWLAARATRPDHLEAVHVVTDRSDVPNLQQSWADRGIPVPLVCLESPYRDLTQPVLDHVRQLRRTSPRDIVAVFVPEYVVSHWWEALLHNQSALRLKVRLRQEKGVIVISVPMQLEDAVEQTPVGAAVR